MLDLGGMTVEIVSDGPFWLDGGTMFGVVPKKLWSRWVTPDDDNRIELALNCLLVRTDNHLTLIDTGVGRKLTDKQRSIYSTASEWLLIDALKNRGISPSDIDSVILTHLHLDHVGGCTYLDGNGIPVPTFPNARHYVQSSEWEAATHPVALNRRTYLDDNFLPLKEAGLIELIEGDIQILDGITGLLTGGHCHGHQAIKLDGSNGSVLFPADIVPTTNHLHPARVMAYDLFPLDVLKERERMLSIAADEELTVIFQHDPKVAMAKVSRDDGGEFVARPVI